MSSDKKMVVVVFPGDHAVRDLIEKANALLGNEGAILVASDVSFAKVSPNGFPLVFIRSVSPLGCALVGSGTLLIKINECGKKERY